MLTVITEGGFSSPLPNGYVWAAAIIFLAVTLALYSLRSIGLFVLAKRQEIAHAYLAWIPCVWIYTACKLIGKTRFFGKMSYEKAALIFVIILSIAQVSTFAYDFFVYFPLAGNYLLGRNVFIYENVQLADPSLIKYWTNTNIFVDSQFVYPYGNNGDPTHMINPLNAIYYVSSLFGLASTIITIFMYVNLFRKFWPQHFIVAAILSVVGLFGPLVFIIRKKEPIDYAQFLRSRYQYYNPYGGPYGGPYQYGSRPDNAPTPPQHPFEEFAERGEVDPGEPFKEFIEEDKKDK